MVHENMDAWSRKSQGGGRILYVNNLQCDPDHITINTVRTWVFNSESKKLLCAEGIFTLTIAVYFKPQAVLAVVMSSTVQGCCEGTDPGP